MGFVMEAIFRMKSGKLLNRICLKPVKLAEGVAMKCEKF